MARIVFDLDGTLIDSAPDLHGIANSLLADAGVPAITLDQTRAFIGNGVGVFVEKMRAERGLPDTMHDGLISEFVAAYDHAVHLTVTYPDVMDTLVDLKGRGHVLGICTNKPVRPCHAVLKHLKMDGFFDTVLGGDSLVTRKPNPEPLISAMESLGDGKAFYVGDSEVDAETAQRARIPFLLFSEGYRKTDIDQIPHDFVFSKFTDLVDIIDRLDR